MRHCRPVSVLMVATLSAGLQGGLAILVIPVLSFFFAVSAGPASAPANTATEFGMTFAVVAPVVFAALGFVLGAFMACMFNLFVNQEHRRPKIVGREEKLRVPPASVGELA